jgi:glycosyltransferase involved in cell wall biosynthesis
MALHNATTVALYNPIATGGHYLDATAETFGRIGFLSFIVYSEDGHLSSEGDSRLKWMMHHVRATRGAKRLALPTFCLWPLTGWWESLLWAGTKNSNYIVVHDPRGLRRQLGLGYASALLTRAIPAKKRPTIVTLTLSATSAVREFLPHARIVQARHPIRNPRFMRTPPEERRAVVIGQYKPARDLDLLRRLGPRLMELGWSTTIHGTGWPDVEGWTLDSRYIPEEEFDDLLSGASVLILPYRYYFQSGVAIRAVENGCPVVGRASDFLVDLLGEGYAGLLPVASDIEDWIGAVQSAAESDASLRRIATDYRMKVDRDWRRLADDFQR